jgi:branched-chain amino acid transport system substrate-binding protein
VQWSSHRRGARGGAWRARAPLARSLLIAAILIGAFGCDRAAGTRELRIGFIVPMSGALAPYGGSHLEGARLAVAEANQNGGLLLKGKNYRVVLVEKDGGSSPERALATAQELISREQISAIVGPIFSSQAIPVARLADKAGIPMIDQIATNPAVTRGSRSVFRVSCTDEFQGEAMARFAFQRLKARRTAILFDVASAYNSGVADIFTRQFVSRGGLVVASETYTTGEADFRMQLRRIAAARPDVLFLPNYPNEIQPQVGQMHELGIDLPLLGSDAMSFADPAYMKAIDGAWYSVHFTSQDPNPKTVKFLEDYQREYAKEPDQGVALSYDALELLFEVVRARQSVDAAEILAGLSGLDTFEGVTGEMIFRGSHDPRKGLVVVRMTNGKPRFEARIGP